MLPSILRLDRWRDPLLERDYLRICSRPATFRNRTFAAAAVGIVFLCIYGGAGRYQTNDAIGRILHVTFTWLASFYVGSLAMMEAAVAIPTERATGTLTVLLTVPRTPRRLAAGFFLSRLLVAYTGLLGILPVYGASLLLGGVSLRSFLLALLIIAISGVYGAAVGLFSGYGAPTHRHAQGRSMFLSFVLVIVLPLFTALVPPFLRLLGDEYRLTDETEALVFRAAGLLFAANPLGAVCIFTGAGIRAGMPWLPSVGWVYALPTAVALGAAAAAVLVTGSRLRDDTERALLAGSSGPVAWLRRILGRRRSAAAGGAPAEGAAPPASGDRHRVWRRPLWWKESRPPKSGWQRLALRVGYVAYFAFLAWLFFHPKVSAAFDPEYRHAMADPRRVPIAWDLIVSFPLWIVLLGSVASGGTFLAEEREKMSLDHLRTAPLRPSDFILARTVAVAVRIWPLLAITGLFAAVGAFRGQVHVVALAAWLLGMAPVAAFLSLLGFWRGMGAATVRIASRRAGLVIVSLLVLWPMGTGFLAAMFHRIGEEIGMTMALNPLVSAVGPILLWVNRATGSRDRDAAEFGLLATGAAAFWGFAAWFLWKRLPRALDRALHAEERE